MERGSLTTFYFLQQDLIKYLKALKIVDFKAIDYIAKKIKSLKNDSRKPIFLTF